jgi:hypothetical protein
VKIMQKKETGLWSLICPQSFPDEYFSRFQVVSAHDVVHFIYMHYLLVLDRHDKCPVPMEEIGQKGSAKLCRLFRA